MENTLSWNPCLSSVPSSWLLITYFLVLASAFTLGRLSRHRQLSWCTPGSTVLCELTRGFHPVLSPSCVAEDWFQVGLDRGCPCLQLASSSSAPRAGRCGKEKVLDQLPFGTSSSMTKPAQPSLHEQCRYTCKAEAATQFHGLWFVFMLIFPEQLTIALCVYLAFAGHRGQTYHW